MMLSRLFVYFVVFAVIHRVFSKESCYQYRRTLNVTIDTDQCSWQNYTQPKTKRFCLESCFNNHTCSGVVTVDEQLVRRYCYMTDLSLRYSQPGDKILYYKKEAELECKRGWTGQNCDSCAPKFEPPGECSRCRTRWTGDNCSTCATGWTGDDCNTCALGWTGEDCDTCADGFLPPTSDQICDGFGCCNYSTCQGCIQNGRWSGTLLGQPSESVMTFRGERCSEVVPGTSLNGGIVTGGSVDDVNKMMTIIESGGSTYEGAITQDKNFTGMVPFFGPFSLSYVSPTVN